MVPQGHYLALTIIGVTILAVGGAVVWHFESKKSAPKPTFATPVVSRPLTPPTKQEANQLQPEIQVQPQALPVASDSPPPEKPPAPPADYTWRPELSSLPDVRQCVQNLESAIGSAQQIPATVINKGILRNIPYLSFRSGACELNVYGDPSNPAGIEFGIYFQKVSSLNRGATKQDAVNLMKKLLDNADANRLIDGLNLNKDAKRLAAFTFEITPQTDEDAYGGWWISIYDEKRLNSVRASDQELATITAAINTSEWSDAERKQARDQNASVYTGGYTYSSSTQVGPRGGVYHYTASGKKSYSRHR